MQPGQKEGALASQHGWWYPERDASSPSLFDVYEGDKLPEGKKSYALSFILEDTTKTLTDSAIDRAMSNLIRAFEQHAGAEIRS